jgi:anti-sigma28 factor (negative regulator of flagellin synthesis)
MHIDPNSSTNIHPASTTPSITQSTGPIGRTSGSGEEHSDGVQLSRLSSVLNGFASDAAGSTRVSSLSTLVQSGAYQINPLQVSERMIDDALRP